MGTSSQGTLAALPHDLATAVERAGRSVVAVNVRPRVLTSGVVWHPGVVVATNHTIRRDEEITVGLPDGRTVPAALAGRDPSQSAFHRGSSRSDDVHSWHTANHSSRYFTNTTSFCASL